MIPRLIALLFADEGLDAIRAGINSFGVLPGTRISKAGVAQRFDTSRHPVRDVFRRLSLRGSPNIWRQRATEVGRILAAEIPTARFRRPVAARDPDRTGPVVRRHIDRILNMIDDLLRSGPDRGVPGDAR